MEQKTGPKDIFLHLLSIITLYVAVGSFISLIFQYVNVLLPDPLESNYYYISGVYSSIRWAISILIVVFPVYTWSVWFLNRGYAKVPEKREMKSRRWLIYFTVFLAALIMIGDLVALVYNLLQGEFTTRFLLKVLAVLLTAAAVFIYYLWDVRKSGAEPRPWFMTAITWGSIVAVAVSIVGGFFIVGSPALERAYRFDDERVSDLQNIQEQVVNFWQAKQKLPQNLSELKNSITGFIPPKDPENQAEYIYEKTGNLNFKLCANFSKPSRGGENSRIMTKSAYPAGPYGTENWDHDQGRVCFERTIDPAFFPPLNKAQ